VPDVAHISGEQIDVLAYWLGADFDDVEDCCIAAYLVPLHEVEMRDVNGYVLMAKEVRCGR